AAPAGPRRTPRRLKLPTWDDLAGGNGPAAAAGRRPAFDSVSTLRFALFLLVLALAVTLYVGHVHASQEVLTEVQRLRRENLDLHLKYNRLKGEYDQMTSPARIYERARGLGLVEDVTYGGTITIER
ncbi:cell division protein FtsL, partial [Rhodocaloribacter litoris]|uniref:FtsL-like putative cell division protein n=1 Tax=Rhodocaloribacter litoris TaxID=2558931 RepID=UPI001E598B45